MRTSFSRCLLMILVFVIRCWSAAAQIPGEPTPTISSQLGGAAVPQAQLVPVARLEGLEFVNGSGSQIVLERDGKRYLIDTKNQTIREFVPTTVASAQTPAPSGQTTPHLPQHQLTKPEEKKEPETYYTEDIVLLNLPTAMHLPKKALMIDFTHRFAFNEAFEPGAMSNLFGMDGFSLSSLGFTYGITNRWFAGIYRTPTTFGRIMQLSTGLQLTRENSVIRFQARSVSVLKEPITSVTNTSRAWNWLSRAASRIAPRSTSLRPFRLITVRSRSLPLMCLTRPGGWRNTTALGAGLSLDIRPTVAILGEAIYRVDGRLDTVRPSFMLGIQKKILSTLLHPRSHKLSRNDHVNSFSHSQRLWV